VVSAVRTAIVVVCLLVVYIVRQRKKFSHASLLETLEPFYFKGNPVLNEGRRWSKKF
jgi:hypothetical protein